MIKRNISFFKHYFNLEICIVSKSQFVVHLREINENDKLMKLVLISPVHY